jgi:hypothetical protein
MKVINEILKGDDLPLSLILLTVLGLSQTSSEFDDKKLLDIKEEK